MATITEAPNATRVMIVTIISSVLIICQAPYTNYHINSPKQSYKESTVAKIPSSYMRKLELKSSKFKATQKLKDRTEM